MPIANILFGFKGRIRRRDWWVFSILLGMAQFCANAVVYALAHPSAPAFEMLLAPQPIESAVLMAVFLWPTLALTVKRMHDRGKSAWLPVMLNLILIAVSLIPAFPSNPAMLPLGILSGGVLGVGSLYILIALGCFEGTPGPNQFGPSPKALEAYPQPSM